MSLSTNREKDTLSDKSDTTSTGSKTLALILAALSVIGFVAVIVTTILATRELGDAYRTITQTEYEANDVLMLAYNDHLYAELGHGMSVDPVDTDPAATVAAFLESSLRGIQLRILGIGLFYALLVSVPAALLVNRACYNKVWITANFLGLLPVLVYGVFVIVAAISFRACGMPVYSPGRLPFFALFAGTLALKNAGNLLGFLLYHTRFKGLVTILAVPAVIALFAIGFVCEYGILSEPTVSSFDYVAEIDSRVLDENSDVDAYYDEERNVLVVGDDEYEPEMQPNPDHLTGAGLVGAIAFELLSPTSGIGLELIRQEVGFGWLVIVLYYFRNVIVVEVLRYWRDRIRDEFEGWKDSPADTAKHMA